MDEEDDDIAFMVLGFVAAAVATYAKAFLFQNGRVTPTTRFVRPEFSYLDWYGSKSLFCPMEETE